MKKVAAMLTGHRPLLLNWFRADGRISGGAVEGFNNHAKLTMRRSFGFRTFTVIELALFHTLGKLPEPTGTHRLLRKPPSVGRRAQAAGSRITRYPWRSKS